MHVMKVVASYVFYKMKFPHKRTMVIMDQLAYSPNPTLNLDNIFPLVVVESLSSILLVVSLGIHKDSSFGLILC